MKLKNFGKPFNISDPRALMFLEEILKHENLIMYICVIDRRKVNDYASLVRETYESINYLLIGYLALDLKEDNKEMIDWIQGEIEIFLTDIKEVSEIVGGLLI